MPRITDVIPAKQKGAGGKDTTVVYVRFENIKKDADNKPTRFGHVSKIVDELGYSKAEAVLILMDAGIASLMNKAKAKAEPKVASPGKK